MFELTGTDIHTGERVSNKWIESRYRRAHGYGSTKVCMITQDRSFRQSVVAGEALFLQLNLATSLGQFTRSTAPCHHTVATTTTLDTVSSTNVGTDADLGKRVNMCWCAMIATITYLEDPSKAQTTGKASVDHAIRVAAASMLGVGVAFRIQMVDAPLVLPVGDAGKPACHAD